MILNRLRDMNDRNKLMVFIGTILVLTGFYLFMGLTPANAKFFLRRRIPRILAMYVLGIGIGTATTMFQTVTRNRILTPSILGVDAMYLAFNSAMLFIFSTEAVFFKNSYISFAGSTAFTIGCTLFIHKVLFGSNRFGIDKIVLIGIVIGTLFKSVSTLIEIMLDPNEFTLVQDMSFASINNLQTGLLYMALPAIIAIVVYVYRLSHMMDVMALGRDHSINLGIEYDVKVRLLLLLVAVTMSLTTSLVGPMAFFGIILINLARETIQSVSHKELIKFSSAYGVLALVGAQFVLERFLNNLMPIGVLISFAGGLYFIIVLVRESDHV